MFMYSISNKHGHVFSALGRCTAQRLQDQLKKIFSFSRKKLLTKEKICDIVISQSRKTDNKTGGKHYENI